MSRSFTALTVVAVVLAAGCSGGGSPPSPSRPASSAAPSSAGPTTATATIVIHGRGKQQAARTVRQPRGRAYVSTSTAGVIARFLDTNAKATYQGYTLSAGVAASNASPASCGSADPTSGNFTCTLMFSLTDTASPYTVQIVAYDVGQIGTTGTPSNGAKALSVGMQSVTIKPNEPNPTNFVLQGIVAQFTGSPAYVGTSGVLGAASPMPTFSARLLALDGDGNEIDTTDTVSNFAYAAGSAGPFTYDAVFSVAASDADGCASSPCISTSSASIAGPGSEGVAFSYNGMGLGGDGVSTPPYYGTIAANQPTAESSALPGSIVLVPFFASTDTTSAYATDASHVAFTASGQTITLYAEQHHLPDGSGDYNGDASGCGSGAIATISGPKDKVGYGASFTLTAGATSGTCVVTLDDGAGDSSSIDVTNTSSGSTTVTVPCGAPTAAPNARPGRSDRTRSRYAATACASPSPAPSVAPG